MLIRLALLCTFTFAACSAVPPTQHDPVEKARAAYNTCIDRAHRGHLNLPGAEQATTGHADAFQCLFGSPRGMTVAEMLADPQIKGIGVRLDILTDNLFGGGSNAFRRQTSESFSLDRRLVQLWGVRSRTNHNRKSSASIVVAMGELNSELVALGARGFRITAHNRGGIEHHIF